MPPQVPYSGVPTVAPADNPTPYNNTQASPDMFGAGRGQATENLGRTLQKAGDELFVRASAMQELYNQSEAQQADVDYITQVGELNAQYSIKQGRDAVDGYKPYIESITSLRQKMRSGLSNPHSQKLFDSQTLPTLSRTTFSAASHSASENKKYALGTSTARISAAENQTLQSPTDQKEFDGNLLKVNAEVRQQAALLGWSPEQTEEAWSEKKSNLWSQRVQGLVKTQPFEASKMLDEAISKGDIRGEAIGKLSAVTQQARNTVGARQISNRVNTGADLSWGSTIVDVRQAQMAIGEFESGGNYASLGRETGKGRALGKYQVMPYNLQPWLKESGLPPMTEKEFLANPSAQDQVFNTVFGGYMKKHGSFNEAVSLWFSGKTIAESGGRSDVNGTTVPGYIKATNAILARNAPLDAKVQKGVEIASTMSPNDPLFPDFVTNRITSDYSTSVRIKKDAEYNNTQTVAGGLLGDGKGNLPTTLEELKADPKVSEAWDNLPPTVQRRFMGNLAQNAKGDTSWTEDGLRTMQRFKGMAQTDPKEFLETDVISADVPMSGKRELLNLQMKLKSNVEGDPRVSRAMQILGPDLAAAQIDSKNKEALYMFKGSLQDALELYQTENKKAPNAEEVRKIGARLMQEQYTGRPGWLNSLSFGLIDSQEKDTLFKMRMPSEKVDELKAVIKDRTGVEPSDAAIQREFVRQSYQKLYGGKPPAAKPASPTSPQVPISQ